ncbi:hypothetical protein EZV62_008798 [Acer yangbiense]|uniref:Uncharacterized protein n=1 Tax=Acer yangbiense TaxID=1000413 RepID=A0A5C7IDY6_9ROSI|nr:hypothetical protein EZV62_008798 [Acer yangbiense]
MANLRLLLFTYDDLESNEVHLSDNNLESNEVRLSDGRLNSLPDELIILEWPTYPLRALPSNFSPEKLVKLDLSHSNIEQLWKGTKHAPKLKWLILIYCQRLTRIPNLSHFLLLENVDLRGCKSLVKFPSPVQQHNKLWYLHMDGCSNVEFPSSVQQLTKLRYLSLGGCSNVTKFPLTSASIESLDLRDTAIEEVPSSIQSLTNLTELDLTGCRRLKHISASIFKLKYVHSLNLDDCSELETFPEISETMEILNSLELSGTTITYLRSSIEHLNGLQRLTLRNCKNLEIFPSGICDLTSLEDLGLYNCSKLDKLPDNLGNLKSLKELRVRGSAVGQLPSSIKYLENLEILDCSKCWGLTKLPPLSDLRRNMFESLPKSIKHLSKLKTLLLRDCNMLRSLTELPVALQTLDAINCKQLCQALPDASEFKRCITSKYHISRPWCARHRKQLCPPHYEYVNFSFTNCFNLDQKAVSNVFEESLKGSEEPPTQFSIYLPGNKIPEWFTYQSPGSSINMQVLRQDLVNRKFTGFAICAVLGIEEYHSIHVFPGVRVCFHFETCDDYISFSPSYDLADDPVFIHSNHILLGYSSFSKFLSSSQNLDMLIANDSNYVDIPFEFKSSTTGTETALVAWVAPGGSELPLGQSPSLQSTPPPVVDPSAVRPLKRTRRSPPIPQSDTWRESSSRQRTPPQRDTRRESVSRQRTPPHNDTRRESSSRQRTSPQRSHSQSDAWRVSSSRQHTPP